MTFEQRLKDIRKVYLNEKQWKELQAEGTPKNLESSWHIPEMSKGGQSSWSRGGKSEPWDGENEGLEHIRQMCKITAKCLSHKLWVWDCRGKVFGREGANHVQREVETLWPQREEVAVSLSRVVSFRLPIIFQLNPYHRS